MIKIANFSFSSYCKQAILALAQKCATQRPPATTLASILFCILLLACAKPCLQAQPPCTPPTAFNVVGDGVTCTGVGVQIYVDDSELDISYQLLKDNVDYGAPVIGQGSPIVVDFGDVFEAGTYTVVATEPTEGCTTEMTGSAVVTLGVPVTCYADTDIDNYGDPNSSQAFCDACATGFVSNDDDCNDANNMIYPGATETCNAMDDNCDGTIDEGTINCSTAFCSYLQVWTAKTSFPNGGRSHLVSVAISGKVYAGTGSQGATHFNDWWEYDPATDAWTQLADFGGGYRREAVAVVIAGKAYAGMGVDAGGNAYDDWWEYDPATNAWTPKASYPFTRVGTFGFVLNGKAYVGGGVTSPGGSAKTSFQEYDPATDAWTAKAPMPVASQYANAFVISGKGYYCGGEQSGASVLDLLQYDPAADTWTSKTSMPQPRSGGIDFVSNGRGFVVGGKDEFSNPTNTVQFYDPATNTWSGFSAMPAAPRMFGDGVAIGNDAYLGFGENLDPSYFSDWWKYEPYQGQVATPFFFDEDEDGYGDNSQVLYSCTNPGGLYVTTGGDCHDNNEFINPAAAETCDGVDQDCDGLIDDGLTNCVTTECPLGNGTWAQKGAFPGIARYNAAAIAIGSEGYLGMGDGDSGGKSDWWKYDPATDAWEQKATFGGGARSSGVAIAVGSKGYYGFGYDVNYDAVNDWWEYDPAGNTWTPKAVMASTPRVGAFGWELGGKAYVGGGADAASALLYDFWEYDPALNTWTAKADAIISFPGICGYFALGGKGYVAGGFDPNTSATSDEATVYDPATNSWSYAAALPAPGFNFASFPLSGFGYLATGYGAGFVTLSSVFRYDPVGNSWETQNDFSGGARVGAAGFALAGKAYLGTGASTDFLNDWWELTPDDGMPENLFVDFDGDGYGDPAQPILACPGFGYSSNDDDCDDFNSDAFPGNTEVCDGADNNCDGAFDEGFDVDNDGYTTCGDPSDCDDTNDDIYPGATEICNSADDNCNGITDSDNPVNGCVACGGHWFDGGGAAGNYPQVDYTVTFCPPVPGDKVRLDFLTIDIDGSWDNMYIYDGENTSANSLASFAGSYTNETVVATGDNASGCLTVQFDYGSGSPQAGWDAIFYCCADPVTYYPDADMDGYGDANAAGIVTCDAVPPGNAPNNGDCDDTDPDLNPGETEICNGMDENCNGFIDDGITGCGTTECAVQSLVWTQQDDFPGASRSLAAACAIGTKGYLGTGYGSGNLNDWWEYDPATDAWTQKTDLPANGRNTAICAAAGGKAYLGGGTGSTDYDDWWEYDPTLNSWTQKADMTYTTFNATAFTIGSKIYMAGGYNGNDGDELFEYDPALDAWTQKSDMPQYLQYGASFVLGGKGYVAAGQDDFLFEYDPVTDTWTEKASTPADVAGEVGFALGGKGFLVAGYNDDSKKVYSYDPAANAWTTLDDYPDPNGNGLYDAVALQIGDKAYLGVGATNSNNTVEWWELRLTSPVAITLYADADGDGYGNPAMTILGCPGTPGTSENDDDCNDNDDTVHPGATELCNAGVDDDCDGVAELDEDLDGFYDCEDCHDNNEFIYPGAPETCNNTDDDCDGLIDDGLVGCATTVCGVMPNWSQKANVGGSARVNAMGLTIGSKGYIGGGQDEFFSTIFDDFWEYDPATDAWTQKADLCGGGNGRWRGFAFGIGSKGYLGTGAGNGFVLKNDFWEYDPVLNFWEQRANFGGGSRVNAFGLAVGSKGYAGTGLDNGFNSTSDFWEYDPVTDTWTARAAFGGGDRARAVAFAIGSKGYAGTGESIALSFSNDFWEYNPATDAWTAVAAFAGATRTGAAAFALNGKGFAGTGYLEGYVPSADFWQYDPTANAWVQKDDLPGARQSAVAFAVGNNGYVGTGNTETNGGSIDFYQFDNTGTVLPSTMYTDADGDGYGDSTLPPVSACPGTPGYTDNDDDCDDTDEDINPAAAEICNNSIDEDCDGVTPSAATPTVDPTAITICEGETTTLTATVPSGTTVVWYDAATGGNEVGSGTTLAVTPAATTSYFAEAQSSGGSSGNQTFGLTGAAQTFTVPAGVTSVHVVAKGAVGGVTDQLPGGNGGKVEADLTVTPGQLLTIYVGGTGTFGGGFNGGGANPNNTNGGGGATDVRVGAATLADRVLVAGGGGGSDFGQGGGGGGATGQAGGDALPAATGGGGGTQSAGGSEGFGDSNGLPGTLGAGGEGGGLFGSGGGGGLYGGGGAGGDDSAGAGGGGGSSYTDPALCSNVTHTQGNNTGDGSLVLSWDVPGGLVCASATRTEAIVTVNLATPWYYDDDGDGYGVDVDIIMACAQPDPNHVATNDDCDDDDDTIFPGATEVCDGVDEDCDGLVDDGLTGCSTTECSIATAGWEERTDFPGAARFYASGASVGSKAYFGLGDTNTADLDDWWEYNPATDVWTQKTTFPGGGRRGAVAIEINGKIYLGGGSVQTPFGILTDWWEYDPATNAWTEKTEIGNGAPAGIYHYAFSIGSKGYIAGGYDGVDYLDTTWEYDPLTDTWTAKADMPQAAGQGGSFVIDGIGYAAGGYNADGDGDFNYAFDPVANTWTVKAPLPSEAGDQAAFALGGKGYLIGNWNVLPDFLQYDPATDTWAELADFPGGGFAGGVGFVVNGRGYVCTGYGINGIPLTFLWKYTPEGAHVLASTWYADTDGDSYGDPGTTLITCEENPTGYVLDDGDCDDEDEDIHPNAVELCNGVDDDCNGTAEPDADVDGYFACEDCNDNDASVNPGELETCDDVDEDCDGLIDDGLTGCATTECTGGAFTWTEMDQFDGGFRYYAVALAVGGKGYLGTGYGANYLNDWWEYDPATDAWTQKTNFAGSARYRASGIAIGSKGYVGMGENGSGRQNDWYEYDPVANTWTAKSSLPGAVRSAAFAFEIGGLGYLGGGENSVDYLTDFYQYDPVTNAWTVKATYPGASASFTSGFAIGALGYVAGGYDGSSINDVFAYNPVSNAWTQKADLPEASNSHAAFVLDGTGYLVTKDGGDSKAVFAYDASTNAWATLDDFPGEGRYGAVGFAIGETGYVGTGYGSQYLSDWWKFSSGATLATLWYADLDGDTYGDPDNTTYACEQPANYLADLSNGEDCDDTDEDINPVGTEVCDNADDDCNGLIDDGLTGCATTECLTTERSWAERTPFPTVRYYSSAVALGGKAYVGLGDGASGQMNDWWEYDPGTDAWTQKLSFPGAVRSLATTFSSGSKIYAGLGSSSNTRYADWYEYDPAANTWAQKATHPGGGRTGAVGFAIGSKGYAAAGEKTTGAVNEVWEYDPAADAWTQKNNIGIITPGYPRLAGVIDGKAYVAGFYNPNNYSNKTLEYDPVADAWAFKADIPVAISETQGFVLDNKLHLVGGETAVAVVNTHYVYDPATNAWSVPTGTGLPNPVAYGAGFAINGVGYVVGGLDGNYAGLNDLLAYDYTVSLIDLWYADLDDDAFGDPDNSIYSCEQPANYIPDLLNGEDCDDTDPDVHPFAAELCNGIDDNCDGTGELDADNDTFLACDECDDNDPTAFPGATEICDNADDDCDGLIDDGLIGCSTTECVVVGGIWSQKNDFAGGVRVNATATSIGDKGYFGTGSNNSGRLNDWWEYNPATDIWTQKANFPGGIRSYASAVTIGGKAYVGFGLNAAFNFTNDWYEYDPLTNTWLQKASCTGAGRYFHFAWALGGKGYVGGGYGNSGSLFDLWQYDPVANAWVSRAAYPGGGNVLTAFFDLGGLGYVAGGNNFDTGVRSNQSWAYDPVANTWAQKGNLPYPNDENFGFGVGGKGYVVGGNLDPNGDASAQFMTYDPTTNTWSAMPNFPGGIRQGPIGFVVGGSAYLGTGYGIGGVYQDDWWVFGEGTAPATLWYADTDSDTYGNPNSSTYACTAPTGYVADHTDCDDAHAAAHPGGTEICDGLDNDCDNSVDEGNVCDGDGDGYTIAQGDCDDANNAIYPNAPEVCNNIDDDCDLLVDILDPNYVDAVNPVAVCQNVTVQLNASGMASVTAAQINNGSTDNCTIASLSLSQTMFDCDDISGGGGNSPPPPQGNVILTVTDGKGNTHTCTATVTVQDLIAPVAMCQNITVQLSGTGTVTITPSQVNNGSSDNCSVSLGLSQTMFDCDDLGANTVTLTATDPATNSHTCTATVTVEDDIDPTAMCQNITKNLNSGGTASLLPAEVYGTGGDNCGMATPVSVTPNSFTCSNLGANTVTLTIDDGNGNMVTCTATVTIQDVTAPSAVCQNITVNPNSSGNVSITASQVNNGSSDVCGTLNLVSVSPNSFTCSNLGANTVTLTVNDGNGNTNTCTATVTVTDNTAPTAICQNIGVQLDVNGMATITPSQVNNGSTDNCGTVNLVSVLPNSFNASNTGPNTVTLTINDGHGNTSTCTATVTVGDNTPPNAVCQNITVALIGSSASITPAQVNNGSNDNSGTVNLVSVLPNSFTCSNLGANTVTLTVSDPSGNMSTCTATVTVTDNTAPTAICQNITVNPNASGNASITASQINNGSTDNCGTVNLVSVSPNSFTCSNLGGNTVTLTINDGHGNTNTCLATVTVSDNTAPTAICQNIGVQLGGGGTVSITPSQINNGSTDNCGMVNLVSVLPNSFNASNTGPNTVTLTINDGHGNTNTCTAIVTVGDNTPPNAVCQNITVALIGSSASIAPAQVNNGSNDNSGTVNLVSVTPNSFTCSNLGANTVTLTVSDPSGNMSTCTATVTVIDNTPPTAICQNISISLGANGTVGITPAQINNASTDNCGTVNLVSVSPNSFNASNTGPNTVTLTINDGHGNTSTCTATVTVGDNTPPNAVCQNITVALIGSSASITPAQVNNGSNDNSGTVNLVSVSPNSFTCSNLGGNTVTLTVSDPSGNMSTCTATVTVTDNTAPTAICQNITVNPNASGNASITASQINNGSTDNCGTVNLVSVSPNSFTCSNLGTNTVTLTVNDGHGNTNTCTATVTVSDNMSPTVTCQASLSPSLNAQGEVTITPAMVFLNGTDNCGTVNLVSVSPSYFSCNDDGPNTATLTVNDGHGNVATCTTTVNIQDNFIVITSVSTVNENCGEINGGIVITATSLGGQLGYSINGGQSFNLTGEFAGLSAGTYDIVVIAYGTASCSEYYGMVTVGSTGSVQTWYKDLDNDGYSDGLSQQLCTQPLGYKLAANLTAVSGDCNDNDPLQHPGQVWFKDADNDGYSNGVVIIQCARPIGFKTVGELTGAGNDCNDANAAIHPGATEICNSLDDDCDGLIDEGVSGGLTYVGNVSLTSQAAVNVFSSCFSVIQGNLLVQNSGVLNLTNLANLVKVTGNVTIKNTSLLNMNGLHNLDTIGGNLLISINNFGPKLQSLDGLEDLDWIGGTLKVYQNYTLTDCCAIHDLIGAEPNGVGGIISIYSNLTTCDNVAAINADCGGSNIIVPPGSEGLEIEKLGNWEIGKVSLQIFPNPVSSSVGRELTLRIEGEFKEGSLRVFDAMGRTVIVQKLSGGTADWKLETGNWKTGIYLVQTLLDGVVLTKKLIVE